MLLPGYRIGDSLARSLRTAVNRAVREPGGERVVLKCAARDYPLADEVLRLEFEHRILDKLRGPGVVELLGVERLARSPVLVLEDFGATSLADVGLPLPFDQFFAVAELLIQALARVHAAQVIHKDIKPSNVLWNAATGVVKLIDFQLSAEVSRERQDLNVKGQLEGSLPYISPEQTGRMNRSLDYRTDYYSLGVSCFELLTGKLPFEASDMMGWVHCHVSKAAPLASDVNPRVPRSLALCIDKLMSKEPSQRYQGSRGLLADLSRCREAARSGRGDEPFALGSGDVSERFAVSQELVGRRVETEKLLDVFERASAGRARLLLVSGHSGVGKSSLIGEVQRPICAKGGYFIAGKFDQLERSVPYAALVQAFRALTEQVLAESAPRVAACRERIVNAVGSGLSLLAAVLPDLTRLVGPQPPPETADAQSAQNRFKLAFTGLVRALAKPDAPLVIFLDDLQWTDPSTPDLLVDVLSNPDVQHLLVIGAFRGNEVHEGHLLTLAVRQLRARAPEAIDELAIEPLGPAALAELVANTLRTSADRCAPLAEVVLEKSQGNPFFASEFLTGLYKQSAIWFEHQQGQWTWDVAAVRAAGATENVIDLMVKRLAMLPESAVLALELAACLGNEFSLSAVAALLDTDPSTVAQALWEPTREGLIVPLTDNYRLMRWATEVEGRDDLEARFCFQHDRVQEAAYSLIAVPERAATHLRIGRKLLAQTAPGSAPDNVFAVTNHLNLGRALIADAAERLQLARLNQRAAAKALSATAFGVAARYHDAAVDCMSPDEWAQSPELRFELFSQRVSSVLMAGERERAAALCEELFAWAPSNAQRGQVFLTQCEVMLYRGDLHGTVEAVRQGLALFGIDLPAAPDAIHSGIGAGIGKMQAHLARIPVDQLPELPELTDPEFAVAMQLLYNVVPAAIMIYPPLFVLAELLMFDLALVHGITAVSAKNFVDCGMIQGQFLGDFDTAYRLGKAAFRVIDRFAARSLGTSVNFVFGAFVSSWGAPYEEALAACRAGAKLSIETGDLLYLGYNYVLYPRLLLLVGRPLPECETEGLEALALMDRIGANVQKLGVRLCTRAVARLADATVGMAESAEADLALERDIATSGNKQWGFQYGEAQMLASVLLGDWDAAERWSVYTHESLMAASTYVTVPEHNLLECLITGHKRWALASESERAALLEDCQARLGKLRGWARGCPENHAHLYALAEADMARLKDEPMDRVLALYERAALAAGDAFIYMRALALELQSQYLRDKACDALADAPLQSAYTMYVHWGAAAKVDRLEAQHPRLFAMGTQTTARLPQDGRVSQAISRVAVTTTTGSSALDIGSVLKATQAISGEVKSEALFTRLMDAMIENAAAQHGCLMLSEDGSDSLVVRALADGTGHGRTVASATPEERVHRVCMAVVRYVARSRDVLVVDDAVAHPQFGREEYVRTNAVKSMLCLPVVNQGRLSAVLYVENNATTYAFDSARIEALRVIAGQAAISIANAELYENLERRVQERTREISARTRKIEAMLDGMHQGVFTIDAELRVQPEYSEHLTRLVGGDDLIGRSLDELLFNGSSVNAEARARNSSALMFSFGASRAAADMNAGHLIREFSRRRPDDTTQFLELEWNWILGDEQTVDRVLVTLRDVTLLRGLARRVAEAEREAKIIAQILDAGLSEFSGFCEASRAWLAADTQRLHEPRPLDQEEYRAIFRSLHTIKGNARALGLGEIAEMAHAAEDALSALDGRGASEERAATLKGMTRLDGVIGEHVQTGQRKLGRLWTANDPRLGQAMAAIEHALALTPERPSHPWRVLSELKGVVHRLHAVPLERVLEETSRALPSLARELGKPEPELDFRNEGMNLVEDWADVIKNALMHAFRNSLDHGIETADERMAAGKPPHGKVALRVESDEHSVRFWLSDDGRGLALDRLRDRAGGRNSSDRELAEAIFAPGISTAREVSAISGRGVGMDAVRSVLRQRGGDAHVEFTGGARQGYRPFALVLELPRVAVLEGDVASEPPEGNAPEGTRATHGSVFPHTSS